MLLPFFSFYEWQEGKGNQKQPYYIYFKVNDKPENKDVLEEDAQLCSRPLLTMAGLFDVWKSPSVSNIIFY